MRMKSLLRRYCILLALLVYWVPNAPAQNAPIVKQIEIRHAGPPATSDELIKSNIRVKVGDPLTRTAIDDDVRNLYATGFFYNIRVAEEPAQDGLKLVYVVMGKLTLTDVRFEGNKEMSLSKLRKKVTSKVGAPLDEQKLFTDAQELKKLYQKSGYQKTEVTYDVIPNEATGRGTVTFKITEAPKIRVDEVTFNGATAFKQKKLRKTIKTRERWFFSWLTGSGTLKDDVFEDDKEKLAEFYRENGYIDFQIKDVKFDQVTDRKVAITFDVFEGRLYKTGNVEIKGNSLFPTEDIMKRLKMTAGANFTPGGLSKDIEAIRDFYGEKGYIDTEVFARKTPNVETGNMDMVYQIEEKDKSFIEKIEIKGNIKTKDKVLRRELAVAPGEVFDMVGVKLSEKRLQGLDYFSKVDARPEPTDVPNRKNLVVGVEEKNTGNFTIGAGFSSVDAVVGFAEVTQGNFDLFNPPYFTGGGQKFRLRTQIGTERQDYQVSFTEPWFLDRKLALGIDIYHRDLGFLSDVYDQTQTGTKLSLTRALGSDFLIGSVSYTVENIGIKITDRAAASPTIIEEEGHRLVSKVGASLAYDTRNSSFLPDAGQRTELFTELAGGPFGLDTDYFRVELRSAWYFKGFGEGHVLELSGRTGVVQNYGDSDRVPLFDRWYLGGMYSLRGFDYREVGPKDGNGEPLGGETYWFGSAEYSIPIIDRLRLAAFYDAGMVYASAYRFSQGIYNTGMYNDNVGIGFRLNLPIGPLRLDYGIPITSDPQNGSSGKFQFGVGYTRDF
ncbi:MAG: outer membrane protein assembly factor BamA [Verrucomicrobiota bacterium]